MGLFLIDIKKYGGKWIAYNGVQGDTLQEVKEKLEKRGLSKERINGLEDTIRTHEEIITEADIMAYGDTIQEVDKKLEELGLSKEELSYTKLPKPGLRIMFANIEGAIQ